MQQQGSNTLVADGKECLTLYSSSNTIKCITGMSQESGTNLIVQSALQSISNFVSASQEDMQGNLEFINYNETSLAFISRERSSITHGSNESLQNITTLSQGVKYQQWSHSYDNYDAETELQLPKRKPDISNEFQFLEIPEGTSRQPFIASFRTTLIAGNVTGRNCLDIFSRCAEICFTCELDKSRLKHTDYHDENQITFYDGRSMEISTTAGSLNKT